MAIVGLRASPVRSMNMTQPSWPQIVAGRIEWPVDGKDVAVTRTVRNAAGAIVHRNVFVSRYHRMVGVTLVGTG